MILRNIVSKYIVSISQKKFDYLKNKYKTKVTEDDVFRIVDIDPTENGVYTEWLLNNYIKNTFRYPEDQAQLHDSLEIFDKIKNKSFFKDNKDINSYKTPGSLYKVLKEYEDKKDLPVEQSKREENVKGQYEIVVKGPDYTWYKVLTAEAACELGSGTSWCTVPKIYNGQPNTIPHEYLEQGPLYILYKGGKPVAQVHIESNQFMDADDDSLSFNAGGYTFYRFAKELKALGEKIDYDVDLEDSNYPDDMIMQIVKSDPMIAYAYTEGMKQPMPELEDVIAQRPISSINYAANVLHGRFPKGEQKILNADDLSYIVEYARRVIKDRWPEGEEELLKARAPDPLFSYINKIIKGPWPEAEDIFADHGGEARWYFQEYLDTDINKVTSPKLKQMLLKTEQKYQQLYNK